MAISSAFFRFLPRLLLAVAGACTVLASPPAVEGGMPSSGAWPLFCGTGLLICALLFPSDFSSPSPETKKDALSLLLAALLWILLLPLLGWFASSWLSTAFACHRARCSRRECLLLPSGLCILLWLGIVYALETDLPAGFLGELLFRT